MLGAYVKSSYLVGAEKCHALRDRSYKFSLYDCGYINCFRIQSILHEGVKTRAFIVVIHSQIIPNTCCIILNFFVCFYKCPVTTIDIHTNFNYFFLLQKIN